MQLKLSFQMTLKPACGTMIWKNPETGLEETVVVVAGGHNREKTLSSSELLFVNRKTSKWINGPSLPGSKCLLTSN
jgi:hypothetical protein